MPVVLLMMYACFAAVGHLVPRTISAYCTGLFKIVGYSFLSRSPRFRKCEAFHVYLTRVRSDYSLLVFFNILTLTWPVEQPALRLNLSSFAVSR